MFNNLIYLRILLSSLILLIAVNAFSQENNSSEEKLSEVSASPLAPAVPPPTRTATKMISSVMNKEYSRPMFFESEEGAVLQPAQFDYDMTLNQNRSLKIGRFELSEKTFRVELKTMGQLHPKLKEILSASEAKKMILAIKWPRELFYDGLMELISRDGEVLWKYELTAEIKKEWEDEAASMSAQISGRKEKTNKSREVLKSNRDSAASFVFKDPSSLPIFKQKQPFRFCFTKTVDLLVTRLCSQRYGVKFNGKTPFLLAVSSDVSPRVILQKEQAELKGSLEVPPEIPFSFYAEMASGQSYEFISPPPHLKVVDLAETLNPQMVRIVGYDLAPLTLHSILNPDQYSNLTTVLGFQATIFDPRKFWMTEISKEDPVLYFPGPGGGVFKQTFTLNDIPKARARPYLAEATPEGTYLSEKVVYGRKLPKDKIESDQLKIRVSKKNPSVFEWTFAAPKSAEYNRSFVQITHEGKVYKSYYELYRAYSNELSLRLGILASEGINVLAEGAYNHWFESLFGWSDNVFSVQRWGISTKYFSSLNPLSLSNNQTKVNLTVLNVDLKYRFTQGLWLRDETTGLMLSHQEITFGSLKAPMVGGGWYWARSMPKVFDDFFNLFPFMNYPKWVDLEFIYYAVPLKSDIRLNNNLALNFHGQVLWSERFFGEMGFGLKRYAFSDITVNQRVDFNTFYGTLGVGFKF